MARPEVQVRFQRFRNGEKRRKGDTLDVIGLDDQWFDDRTG